MPRTLSQTPSAIAARARRARRVATHQAEVAALGAGLAARATDLSPNAADDAAILRDLHTALETRTTDGPAPRATAVLPKLRFDRVFAQTLIDAVRTHARANYETGGWDLVIETMTDEDILGEVMFCKSPAGAIKKMGARVGLVAGVRADIRNA